MDSPQALNKPVKLTSACAVPFWRNLDDIKIVFVLTTITCLLLFFELGIGKTVLDPSEGFYAEGAREMVETANYLTPYLNYEMWLQKPILTYWFISLSYKLLGVTTFASRLPGALCALGTVLIVYGFVRLFVSRRAAFLSSLILATTPLFAIVGRLSLTDMPLTFFLSTALLVIFTALSFISSKHIHQKQSDSIPTRFLILAYSALSLAVLCKGPIAIVIFALVIFSFLILSFNSNKRLLQSIIKIKPLMAVIIFLLVGAPWFILEIIETKGAFFQEFFIRQNLGRMQGIVDHQEPWWFYVPVLLGGFLPWTIFIPTLSTFAIKLWRCRKQSLKNSHQVVFTRQQSLLMFSILWFLVTFLLFSVVETKLATYIVPALPGLAIAMGLCIDSTIRLNKLSLVRWTVPLALIAFTMLLAVDYKFLHQFPRMETRLTIVTWVLLVNSFIYALLLHKHKLKQAIYLMIAGTIFGALFFIPNTIEAFYKINGESLTKLLDKVNSNHPFLACVIRYPPAASFYLHQQIPIILSPTDMESYLTRHGIHWLLVSRENIPIASKWLGHSLKQIDHQGKWYLFSAD